jgi:hypothetical protein
MRIDNFNLTIDHWIRELDRYDFDQLLAKPSADRWSLGQVYMHLIGNTGYYVEQVKICIATNDNHLEQASANASVMFSNNDFPDERIEGPPENLVTPQPESKEHLLRSMVKLKKEMNALGIRMTQSRFNGKTKHPGLHYFSAEQWVQFADMHLRHHLRQKTRLDDFLTTQKA